MNRMIQSVFALIYRTSEGKMLKLILHSYPPDKPTPPRNLVVSEVTSESAYLTWKAPEDNGGAVISHYVVEKKDVAAEQWVPVSAANKKLSLMAMYLMEGIQYLFRVAAENQFGRSDYVVTKTPIKAVDPLCE